VTSTSGIGASAAIHDGEDAGEREQRERTTSALPYGLRSPSSPPHVSGLPPPGRWSAVSLLPPAAHLPDGQLLVCSPPRAGDWAPAPAGGSPVRWVAGRLTPAPTGRSPPAEQLLMRFWVPGLLKKGEGFKYFQRMWR